MWGVPCGGRRSPIFSPCSWTLLLQSGTSVTLMLLQHFCYDWHYSSFPHLGWFLSSYCFCGLSNSVTRVLLLKITDGFLHLPSLFAHAFYTCQIQGLAIFPALNTSCQCKQTAGQHVFQFYCFSRAYVPWLGVFSGLCWGLFLYFSQADNFPVWTGTFQLPVYTY